MNAFKNIYLRFLIFLPFAFLSSLEARTGPVLLTPNPAAAISGLVVDGAGQPVAGAWVHADPQALPALPVEPVRTGADGRFRLTGLRPGYPYELTVTREGFARTQAAARMAPAGRTTSPLRIVMDGGRTASGRVTGEDSHPVTGAAVLLFDRRGNERIAQATTDGAGRFELRHLPAGRFDLVADHPRHLRSRLAGVEIPADGTGVDLGTVTLVEGAALEGRVTDTRGRPIAGARVETRQGPVDFLDVAPLREGDASEEAVLTGLDGGFRIEGLRRGKPYDVAVQRAGYAAASALGVKAPAAEPLRIEMQEARSLEGQVVGPKGEPVAGAGIVWVREQGVEIGDSFSGEARQNLARTDAEGRFRADGLPPGVVELSVQAEGYRTRQIGGVRIPEDRGLRDVKIVLERAALLDVRVLDADGEPVPDLWVQAFSEEPGQPAATFVSRQTTDADGRCRLNAVPGIYEIIAAEEGRSAQRRVEAVVGILPVELRLPPGAEVSGRVVEEDGAGAADVVILMKRDGAPPAGAMTEGDGAFRLPGLPDGTYLVMARRILSEEFSAPLEITVAGRPVRDLELRLPPLSKGAKLTGRLLGLAPEELPGVYVSASHPGAGRGGRVAHDGSYQIDGLTPGDWSVDASLSSGRSVRGGTVRIEPGDSQATLDLEFPAGLTISGRVLADGAPLAGAGLVLQFSNGNDSWRDRTAYDGSFTIKHLTTGEARLTISGPGGISGSRTLRIAENREVTIELATGRLRGTVLSPKGEPVEGAEMRVMLTEDGGWLDPTSLHSGTGGAFEVPRLAAGTYLVVAEKEGFALTTASVEVRPGAPTPVAIELKPLP